MATYPGGKSGDGVYQTIINNMPPHQIYIEPFLGGGAIMRKKLPATIASIGIDIDAAALAYFNQNRPIIPGLLLVNCHALEWLSKPEVRSQFFGPETLIYIDPPYLMETRSCKRPLYNFEFATEGQHIELLETVKSLPCKIMISGYWSELYESLLSGWQMITFQAQTRSGKPATECLWMNYPTPLELHDYRYLGENYRERERIKRKQQRWKSRLQTMPAAERYALLSVLEDLRTTRAAPAISGDTGTHR